MAIKSTLMLKIAPNKVRQVARTLSEREFTRVSVVAGPYDIIAEFTAINQEAYGEIMRLTGAIEGVEKIEVSLPDFRQV